MNDRLPSKLAPAIQIPDQIVNLGKFTISCALMLSLLGCGNALTFKDYEGPVRPQDELAILVWSVGFLPEVVSIDGKTNPQFTGELLYDHMHRAELLPGEHEIRISYRGRRRVWGAEGVINFKAGHVYVTRADDCTWFCPHRHLAAVWIDDRDTGEVVLGSKELK